MACPFCEKRVQRPAPLEIVEASGGRCECGAVFISDETGTGGGQALIDGLTLLCDGDISATSELNEGQDYEFRDLQYQIKTFTIEGKPFGRGAYGRPKLFFFRRIEKKSE